MQTRIRGMWHLSGDAPTFFDFDHCAYGWRARRSVPGRSDEIQEAVLAGYESIRAVTPEERAAFPTLGYIRRIGTRATSLPCVPPRRDVGSHLSAIPPLAECLDVGCLRMRVCSRPKCSRSVTG